MANLSFSAAIRFTWLYQAHPSPMSPETKRIRAITFQMPLALSVTGPGRLQYLRSLSAPNLGPGSPPSPDSILEQLSPDTSSFNPASAECRWEELGISLRDVVHKRALVTFNDEVPLPPDFHLSLAEILNIKVNSDYYSLSASP